MRAHGSYQTGAGCEPVFGCQVYRAPIDCFVIFPWTSQTQVIVQSVSESWIHALVRRSWSRQHRPRDACKLVRQSNDELVGMHTTAQAVEPSPEAIATAIQVQDAR